METENGDTLYLDNKLDAFSRLGVQTDIRFRIAMDMLTKSGGANNGVLFKGEELAVQAMSAAEMLVKLGAERGYLKEIQEGMDKPLRDQARRGAEYQMEQQNYARTHQAGVMTPQVPIVRQ